LFFGDDLSVVERDDPRRDYVAFFQGFETIEHFDVLRDAQEDGLGPLAASHNESVAREIGAVEVFAETES
jgi:hypothetical protein